MARVGVKIIKDSKGNPKQLLIDIDKHKKLLQEFLDRLQLDFALEVDTGKNDKRKNLKNLLLNGPTFSSETIDSINEAGKKIAEWRKK